MVLLCLRCCGFALFALLWFCFVCGFCKFLFFCLRFCCRFFFTVVFLSLLFFLTFFMFFLLLFDHLEMKPLTFFFQIHSVNPNMFNFSFSMKATLETFEFRI